MTDTSSHPLPRQNVAGAYANPAQDASDGTSRFDLPLRTDRPMPDQDRSREIVEELASGYVSGAMSSVDVSRAVSRAFDVCHHNAVHQAIDARVSDLCDAPTRFDPSMIGRTGTTRHGEHGTIVGPAHDRARCTFRPDGDASVLETFTPMVRHITFDAPARADVLGIMQCNREATVFERAQAWDALMSFADNGPNVDSRAIGHAADVLCEIVSARIRADRSGS